MSASVVTLNSSSSGGSLLRISTFYSSGTWSKGPDIGYVVVHVLGGGGAAGAYYNNSARNGSGGGTSSFGSFVSATGGGGGSGSNSGGVGGTGGVGTNGDINISGGNGFTHRTTPTSVPGHGAPSIFGGGGNISGASKANSGSGGTPFSLTGVTHGNGGGAGGFAIKKIDSILLPNSVTVTVGSGGTNVYTDMNGGSGLVIIYEYGL